MPRFLSVLLASTALISAGAIGVGRTPFLSPLMSSPAWALGGAGTGDGAVGGGDSASDTGEAGTPAGPGVSGSGGGAGEAGGSGGAGGNTTGGVGGQPPGAAGGSPQPGGDFTQNGGGGGGGAHGFIGFALPTTGVTGGAGGSGGNGPLGGGGGAGGWGAVVLATGDLGTLGVAVTGGAGGNAGLTSGESVTSASGTGGTGLFLRADDVQVIIGAAVTGGAGGVNIAGGGGGAPGAGGVGIVVNGSGSTLTINSDVTGGLSGDGVTRANALSIQGSGTTLTLGTAGSLVGGISLGGGTLTMQQPTDATINGVISGTGGLTKEGGGVLTLIGTNTYAGGTTIGGGTVAVGNGSALGTNAVFLSGGVLRTDATMTLTNNMLVFTGSSPTIAAANGTTLTLAGAALDVFGGGTLTFGTAGAPGTVVVQFDTVNLFDAPTTALRVASGTLLAGNSSLSDITSVAATTTIGVGARLDFNGNFGSIADLQGAGTLANSGSIIVTGGNFSGVIEGGTDFAKTGAGTLVLSGANSYSGDTSILGGTLQIGAGGSTGTLGGGPVDVAEGAVLTFNRSNNVTVGNAISGGGEVRQIGLGVLTLSSANTYSGGTTISSGTLELGNAQAAGTGQVTLSGGNARLRFAIAGTFTNAIEVTDNSVVTIGRLATGDGITLTGALSLRPGSTLIFGSPVEEGLITASFGGTDLFTPAGINVQVAGGTLAAGNTSLGSITSQVGSFNIGAIATVQLGGFATTIANLQGAGTLNNTATTTLLSGNFEGVITGSGGIEKFGAGTMVLSGANTYSGTTLITEGTLAVGFGAGSGSLGTGAVTNNAQLLFNRTGTYTVANAISGTGTLALAGGGTMILTGTNTYTGATTINAGNTLQVGDGVISGPQGQLGSGAVVNNGTLVANVFFGLTLTNAISGTGVLRQEGGPLTLTGANTYSGGTTIAATTTLQVGNGGTTGTLGTGAVSNLGTLTFARSDTFTVGNVISGTGAVFQAGSGTLILTGNNTYSGGTSIDENSRIQVGAGGTSGSIGTGAIGNAGVLTFNRSNDITVASQIFGSGRLVQAGPGTLTLTASNGFDGGTEIRTGTLALSGAGSLGSGDITIGNATLRADRDISLANNVIATGSNSTVAAATGRTLTLTGNMFIDPSATLVFGSTTANGRVVLAPDTISVDPTGRVRIAGGTVVDQIGVFSQITSQVAATTIDAGTTLDFSGVFGQIRNLQGSGTLTNSNLTSIQGGNFAGVIAGAGGILMSGTGTLTLTGANTYTGETTVSQGTLQIGNGGGTGTLGTGATFISGGGTLALNRSDAGLVYAGDISNGGTLVQRGSGRSTLSGVIRDLGGDTFTQIGTVRVEAGTLNLTGANTYTGATVVGGGTLLVNGSIASSSGIAVNQGGIVGGNGLLPSITVNAGGSLSPGNSVGTMNISGNLNLTPGSTTIIEVEGPAADRINVSGAVRLAGTLRLVPLGGTYLFSTPYTLIQGQSLSGSFGTVNTQGSFGAGITTTVDSTATQVRLTLNPAPLLDIITPPPPPPVIAPTEPTRPNFGIIGTGNQRSIAAAFDRAVAGGADVSPFFPLYNLPANQIPRGLDLLAGQVHTSGMRSLVDVSFQVMDTMLDSSRPSPRQGQGDSIYSAWASGFGGGYRMGADAVGSAAVTGSNGGMATGTDIRIFPGITVGFAAAGAGTSSQVATGLGRSESSQLQGGGYGIGSFGPMRIGFAVTTAGGDVTTRRQVGFMGPGNLDASYTTQAVSTRMEASWKFSGVARGLDLTPSLIFQNIRFQTPGFTETGPGPLNAAALTVSGRTQGTTRTEIGMRADMDLGYRVNLWGRLAYAAYTQRDSGQTASFANLPNSSFMVTGARPEVNAALISGGVEWRLLPGIMALARFDSEMSSNGFAGRGTARIRMGF